MNIKWGSAQRRRVILFGLALAAAVLATGAALVGDATPTAKGNALQHASAMPIALDPETGTYSLPTGDAAKALDLPAEPAGDPPVKVLPDGTTLVDMRGRARNYAIAHVDAAGRIVTSCDPDADRARRDLLSAADKDANGREVK